MLRETFPEAYKPMTFLELNEGGVLGNTVKARYDFTGIIKERKGTTQNQNMELLESTTTLHIDPDEPFIQAIVSGTAQSGFRGHGIEATHNGVTVTYRIVGYPDGFDFDEGVTEFFRVTLKQESLAEYTDGS